MVAARIVLCGSGKPLRRLSLCDRFGKRQDIKMRADLIVAGRLDTLSLACMAALPSRAPLGHAKREPATWQGSSVDCNAEHNTNNSPRKGALLLQLKGPAEKERVAASQAAAPLQARQATSSLMVLLGAVASRETSSPAPEARPEAGLGKPAVIIVSSVEVSNSASECLQDAYRRGPGSSTADEVPKVDPVHSGEVQTAGSNNMEGCDFERIAAQVPMV